MITDDIQIAIRTYREEFRGSPDILLMCSEMYKRLCEEIGMEDIEVYWGLEIIVDDDLTNEFRLSAYEEDIPEGFAEDWV